MCASHRQPATSFLPGGMTPDTLKTCHLELAPGQTLTVEYGHTDVPNSRDVLARIVGVEFGC